MFALSKSDGLALEELNKSGHIFAGGGKFLVVTA
jgi:hypothetical protein